MHYRLANLADPVLAAIEQTVTHALQHQPIVQRDMARLETLTGCGVPRLERSAQVCCERSATVADA